MGSALALAAARGLIANHWSGWPVPLLGWLRERSAGSEIDWTFRCTRELLPRSGTPYLDELLGELAELERWRAAPPPTAAFHARAQALWHRPGRDRAQTALHRLCWAQGCEFDPEMAGHRQEFHRGLVTLCMAGGQDETWIPRHDLVDWCLVDFERFAADLATTHPEVGDEWGRFLEQITSARRYRDPEPPGA